MSEFDYIDETEAGVRITLKRGIDIDGTHTTFMDMREPTVQDQLTTDKMKGGEAEKELALLANLCEVSPDDLKGLSLADYRRLQDGYRYFLS